MNTLNVTIQLIGASQWDDDTPRKDWRVTLLMNGKTEEFVYHTGMGHKAAPAPTDVIACLASDAQNGSELFADFCDNLGYEADSRRALDIYLACQRTAERLRRLGVLAYLQDPEAIEALTAVRVWTLIKPPCSRSYNLDLISTNEEAKE